MPLLNRLEKIVSRDLVTVTNVAHQDDPAAIVYLMEDLPQALLIESDRIKGLIMKTVSDVAHPNEVRRFIRKCQYRLVALHARLLNYSDADTIVARRHTNDLRVNDIVCHFVYRCLQELLLFLEEHFGRYLYWRAWVHRNYLLLARKEIMSSFGQTEVMLSQLECSVLAQLINRKFQRFFDPLPS